MLRHCVWFSTGLLVACNGVGSRGNATAGDTGINQVTAGDDESGGDEGSADDEGGESGGGCAGDSDCGDGEVCSDGECVSGCNGDGDCGGGESCCAGACVDVTTNAEHCGGCGDACSDSDMGCVDGVCQLGECPDGWADCNGDAGDGCEIEGECTCAPGDTQPCYSGEPDTADVGACRSGTQTCNEWGTAWTACENEVLPEDEICANGVDDNCDGTADEDPDDDGDGWTACGGDCCDVAGPECGSPDLVNPGAFEVDGNMVDDDCDGTVDNPLPACDMGLASNSNDAFDYARGIDLCQFTEEDPATPEERIWGVIEADLLLANGAGAPDPRSRSIRDDFGQNVSTQFGDRLVILSTGHAADNHDDANPNYADFQTGAIMGETSPMPSDWLSANGNNLPNAPGCPDPGDQTARDPVNLQLRVRVPTNANSFSVQMYFYSAEYPEYVCTFFNDFFLTLVDSADPMNPSDGNIAIYDDGATQWPVGINLLSAAAGLFTQCQNGGISQCGGGGTYNGCASTNELLGTGFDVVETPPFCGPNGMTGGGTGWLTMSGNVEPGEIMEIRFIIFDVSDAEWDSLVLLDDWEWGLDESEPGVAPS